MTEQLSQYELDHNRKLNVAGLLLLAAHLPILCAVAWFNNVSIPVVIGVMVVLLLAPAVIAMRDSSSELGAIAIAVAAMGVASLVIYVCHGAIEAHFEIFVLLALLICYGRITPLLVAAGVIAVQHLAFWMWLPTDIFNYNASFYVVLVHAGFVILEVIPACWIASQFGNALKGHGIILEHLGGAADQVAAAAQEISTSSAALAEGASKQAASIEETSASAAEISSMAQRNTESSESTAVMVAQAATRFAETNGSLAKMVTAMNGINESSEKISQIIKVIDQISFQTNILALNAAVEAARAGESGLGFAVVAEEVRNLAQRCAQAASDTSVLIEDCLSRSRAGKSMVEEVASEIRTITADSARMKDVVDEINVGSQDQSRRIVEISRSIHQMEQITQSNAASSEEAAAAASELTAQANLIQDLVERLAALGGTAAQSSTSHRAPAFGSGRPVHA